MAKLRYIFTVSLKPFNYGNVKFKLLHKALVDTGCTKSFTKINRLPDDILSWKVTSEVSWTTNAGKFGTKYNITLQFTFQEFNSSREITWKFSVDETEQQSYYDMIIGRDLQLALNLDILFVTKQFRWGVLSITTSIPNSYLSYLETRIKNIDNSQDVFTTVSTPMSILDAKYEKANIDANIDIIKHLSRI
jgi:hypothetical protein